MNRRELELKLRADVETIKDVLEIVLQKLEEIKKEVSSEGKGGENLKKNEQGKQKGGAKVRKG